MKAFLIVMFLFLLSSCAGKSEDKPKENIGTIDTIDITPPRITLKGANPLHIKIREPYIEPGAFTDDGSGIKIDRSSVNTTVNGHYRVTYNAQDSAGNIAEQIIRTIIVSSPLPKPLLEKTGNLSDYLQNMQFGSKDDGLWIENNLAEQEIVKNIINKIQQQKFLEARTKAKLLDGKLFKFIDRLKTYYILHLGLEPLEDDNYRATGGTYVFYPKGKNVAIQVPHPKFDTYTARQGIESFLALDSQYLLISGTHRHSSTLNSSCQSEYKQSDASHNINHFFFNVHQVLSKANNKTIFIELHGFGSTTRNKLWRQCDATNNLSLINLSEGIDDSNNTSFLQIFHQNITTNTDIKSCIYHPSKKMSINDVYTSILGGTKNTAGRLTNGSNEQCHTKATKSSHRFIHLEQSYHVRQHERNVIITNLKKTQETYFNN